MILKSFLKIILFNDSGDWLLNIILYLQFSIVHNIKKNTVVNGPKEKENGLPQLNSGSQCNTNS
jgi:hypothetical protein